MGYRRDKGHLMTVVVGSVDTVDTRGEDMQAADTEALLLGDFGAGVESVVESGRWSVHVSDLAPSPSFPPRSSDLWVKL